MRALPSACVDSLCSRARARLHACACVDASFAPRALSFACVRAFMHACTHARAHARTHVRVRACARARRHACNRCEKARMLRIAVKKGGGSDRLPEVRSSMSGARSMKGGLGMQMHAYARMCTHVHADARLCTPVHACARRRTQMRADACRCAQMRADAYTWMQMHAYACICVLLYCFCASFCI